MPSPDDFRGVQYLGTEDPNATIHWDDRGAREVSLHPPAQSNGPSLAGRVPSYSVGQGMGGSHPEVALAKANAVARQAPTAQDYEAMIHMLEQHAMNDQASLGQPTAVEPTQARYRMQDEDPYKGR